MRTFIATVFSALVFSAGAAFAQPAPVLEKLSDADLKAYQGQVCKANASSDETKRVCQYVGKRYYSNMNDHGIYLWCQNNHNGCGGK